MNLSDLSERQREMATAIIRGYSAVEIAAMHGIAVKTVYTHRQRVFDALGIESEVQLFAIAMREALADWRPVEHPAIGRAMDMISEVLP